MNEKTRARTLWLLAALTVAYAMLNVAIFFTTASFGVAWFTASLIVYSVFLVGALYLALVDTGSAERTAPAPAATAQAKPEPAPVRASPKLSYRTVVYQTRTGHLDKVTTVANGKGHTNYYAFTPREAIPIRDVETRADSMERPVTVHDIAREVDATVREREVPLVAPTARPARRIEVLA